MSQTDGQALQIDPNEIKFTGPYNSMVLQYLHLVNPTERPIAFKIKTTAPTRYNVKPIIGVVGPSGMASVSIGLHPLVGPNGQPNGSGTFDRTKQKFLLESMFVDEDINKQNSKAVLELFKKVPSSQVMVSKVSCTFEDEHLDKIGNPTQAATNASAAPEPATSTDVGGPLLAGEDNRFGTPQRLFQYLATKPWTVALVVLLLAFFLVNLFSSKQ